MSKTKGNLGYRVALGGLLVAMMLILGYVETLLQGLVPTGIPGIKLGISNGVKVTGLKDGKFKAAGITNGFVVTDINNMRVNNQDEVEDIYNAIMRDKESDKVMFITGIKTNGKKTYIAVDLADPEE